MSLAPTYNGQSAQREIIGIYGGSFNPPHEGHLNTAHIARKLAGLTQLWMLVTKGNPLKDKGSYTYADYDQRIKMCEMLAKDDSDWLKISDFERSIETSQSAEILKTMKEQYPQHKFVWIMGADNLTNFHQWGNWEYIIENFPMLVLGRHGENEQALKSPVATSRMNMRLGSTQMLKYASCGWCFYDNYEMKKISATSILNALKSGQRNVDGLPRDIEQFVLNERLYGLTPAPKRGATPKP